MNDIQQAVTSQTKKIIRRALVEGMPDYALRNLSVRAGEDHDGSAVLFVEAEYALSDRAVDPAATAGLTSRLRELLWQAGETRFPHIRHRFAEGQKIQERRRARA